MSKNCFIRATIGDDERAVVKADGSAYEQATMILTAIKNAYDAFPDNVASIFRGVITHTVEDDDFWERELPRILDTGRKEK